MKVITFASIKGGVGKSASAIVTADILSISGKTLLIDFDPQASCTSYHTNPQGQQYHHVYEVLTDKIQIEDAIITIKDNLDFLPSYETLTDINAISKEGYQFLLKKKIRNLDYSFLVIDTPPSATKELTNALVVANHVYIPVAPNVWSMESIELVESKIKDVKEFYNPDLQTVEIFTSMYESNRTMSVSVYNALNNQPNFTNIKISRSANLDKALQFRNELNPKERYYQEYGELLAGVLV